MIHRKSCLARQEMFFSQLFARFRSYVFTESRNTRTADQQRTSNGKEISKQLSLQINENFSTKKQLNKALNAINISIQSEGPTNQLLLQKADILLRKEKFREAGQILRELRKNQNNPEVANNAQKLLLTLENERQKSSKAKARNLNKLLLEALNKYQQKPKYYSKYCKDSTNPNIAAFVREEARRARSNGLPMLSYELLQHSLQAGQRCHWLLLGKALSLNMMGHRAQALALLKELKRDSSGDKITNSIKQNIKEIENHSSKDELTTGIHLIHQARLLCNEVKPQFLPEKNCINEKTNIKHLVFKETRSALSTNPQAALNLIDLILGYYPGDLAALQLKGEALAATHETNKAIRIWKDLINSPNQKISAEAKRLISLSLTEITLRNSQKRSPRSSLLYFIRQHLNHGIIPTLNKEILKILLELQPADTYVTESELQKHHLQLLFNTLVIDCLEGQLLEQRRSNATAPVQKPGSIRKTAPKAG